MIEYLQQTFLTIPHAKKVINSAEDFTLSGENYLSKKEQLKLKNF